MSTVLFKQYDPIVLKKLQDHIVYIVVVATLFPPFCHKQGPSIYFIKTINL